MAPSSLSSLLRSTLPALLLLNLLPTRLAASTLTNPSLPFALTCLPSTTPNKPVPIDCVRTMMALPASQRGIDFHLELPLVSNPRIVYDTVLTSLGDPNSPYHLPHTMQVGTCRVTVRMAEGVQFARVLWNDVRHHVLAVTHGCVGDPRRLPTNVLGPGAGGSTSIGAVMVSVEYVAPAAGSGKSDGDNFSIGAYYPPNVGGIEPGSRAS